MENSTMLGTQWAFNRCCIWLRSQSYQLWNGFSFSGHKQHSWRCVYSLLMSKQLHRLPYRKKPGFYSQSGWALNSQKAKSEKRLVCVHLCVSQPRESESEEDGLSGWPLWPGPLPFIPLDLPGNVQRALMVGMQKHFLAAFHPAQGRFSFLNRPCLQAELAPIGTCYFRKVGERKQLLEREARKGGPGPAKSWQCSSECKLKRGSSLFING